MGRPEGERDKEPSVKGKMSADKSLNAEKLKGEKLK
jgi:hypothetical protein